MFIKQIFKAADDFDALHRAAESCSRTSLSTSRIESRSKVWRTLMSLIGIISGTFFAKPRSLASFSTQAESEDEGREAIFRSRYISRKQCRRLARVVISHRNPAKSIPGAQRPD